MGKEEGKVRGLALNTRGSRFSASGSSPRERVDRKTRRDRPKNFAERHEGNRSSVGKFG